MKRYLFSISVMSVVTASVLADDDLPKRYDFNRYAGMVEKSPFAVASAPTQVSTTPSWSKDLFIANALHTDAMDMVTVNSLSDKNLKEYLTTEGPNEHGYGIASIEWSENQGATKVTISKDAQFATIGFNEALMSQGISIPNAGQANIPGNIPGVGKQQVVQPAMGAQPMSAPPQAPATALPSPHVRGIIQRKPQQPGQQTPVPNTAPLTPPDQ